MGELGVVVLATALSAIAAVVCVFVAVLGAPTRVRHQVDQALGTADRIASEFKLFRTEVNGLLDTIQVEAENVRKQRARASAQSRADHSADGAAPVPASRAEVVAHYRRSLAGQQPGDGLG